MRINKISKIYVINLDESKDRWARMTERLFKMYGLDESFVERFPAVNSTDKRIPDGDGKVKRIMACSLSHYDIYKMSKERKEGNILIMEDDVFFRKDWIKQLDEFLFLISSFDMLMLNATGNIPFNQNGLRNIDESGLLLLAGAYLLSPEGRDKLLDKYKEQEKDYSVMREAADYRLLWLQRQEQSYFYFPYLSIQENFITIIGGPESQSVVDGHREWFDKNYKPSYGSLYDWPVKS